MVQDDRIQKALDQVVTEAVADGGGSYATVMRQQLARAHALLNNMRAALSTTLIRCETLLLLFVSQGPSDRAGPSYGLQSQSINFISSARA